LYLMFHKRFILSSAAALIALAVGCSKSPDTPVSPSSSTDPSTAAAPDGSKLKATAPTAVSPINNAQPDGSIVLVSTKSTGKFADITPSYEYEVKNGAGTTVYSRVTGGVGSGANVEHTVDAALEFDAPHTWRVRAVLAGAAGPWSVAASFRTPSGGYINSNPEVFDPLTNGRTVGTRIGGTEFIAGTGLELLGHDSRVTYQLPQNLQQGEFSVMVTGIDEGSPGDKTKVMSMQEGCGSDITDNDYRMTVEKRGRLYPIPGAVVFRIIMGDAGDHGRIFDSDRSGASFSDERWYFWKFTWGARAALEVREDGPAGRVVWASSRGTGGYTYRPVPHCVHLGVPVGRAGPNDASIPGAIYKNLWVSARPRPTFPGE
jgi:hypothetical protein